ncbi:hypothetical protein MMINT_09550 [Candidatus Methanomassiliicoccus intestinalis Issoire-Mx1]|uniref:Uncharacterized protein n=1 Tax=Methanomassiliicoccus intestinalis (strain Issoire-Mx1) TaxID=1295009 RepID=R9T6S4_METII|nr:hypothetical protein MMINT_09550 [Candidatus Methanomassiliicoccus intestinalis Issoire-Mx1]
MDFDSEAYIFTYFTIVEWMPKYHANSVLGIVCDVELDGVSLSQEEARELVDSEMGDIDDY